MSRSRSATLPLQHRPGELHPTDVALRAARALLRAESRAQVARVLHAGISALGGTVVPSAEPSAGALPYDVSLGVGEPVVVVPATESLETRSRLERHLPGLLEDAVVAALRCDRLERESRSASTDPLTGVASRREIEPRLAQAGPGDVVFLLDLDRFKELNDRDGHAAGDQALRRFARLLSAAVRRGDFVGRYGGDEFVVVLSDVTRDTAVERAQELTRHWAETNAGLLTVSAGVATVDHRGGEAAVREADAAMYAVKRRGGNAVLPAWRTTD